MRNFKVKSKRLEKIKKDRYRETSKKLLFMTIILVFLVFFMCLYLSIRLDSVELAKHTLTQSVIFSTPVLIAIIAKSGFENKSKGKTRDMILQNMIDRDIPVNLGDEDFRNGV